MSLTWEEAEARHPGCSASFEMSGLAGIPVTLRDTGHFDYQPMFPGNNHLSWPGRKQRLMACPEGADPAFMLRDDYQICARKKIYQGTVVYIDELELWIRCSLRISYFGDICIKSGVWPPRLERYGL